ncbi:MAG TPA: TetR-like C-terminal domain-containing protein [Mycobacterium sp.]|nr:TetR-like C-terminal domain-containing protein [Mycobacterium sp.]
MAAAPLFIAELADNADLSERFRDTPMSTEFACVVTVLDRAAARGDLAGRPDPRKVHSLMLGTAFAWLFVLRREPTPELVPKLCRLVVRAGSRVMTPASYVP